jgi:cytochrome P450
MERHNDWVKEYGPTFRYRILFGSVRFFTADLVALSYILSHSDIFPKPEQVRRNMGEILGNGVLSAEGADHRRQRKVLNPSFSASAVRELVPIFLDKAYDLKDKLLTMIDDESIEASPTPERPEDKVPGGRKIDVVRYLQQCTLDVIGAAGFNYDFASLREPNNELAEAYRKMFSAAQNITIMAILQSLIPGMNKIVGRDGMSELRD